MYLHQPAPSWIARLVTSARTLLALGLIAILASAVSVHWSSQVSATGSSNPGDIVVPLNAIPVAIDGTLVGVNPNTIAVQESGSDAPVAFLLSADTRVVREGQPVSLSSLANGDAVRMTVDGRTGSILRLHATPATPPFQVPGIVALLASLGLIAGAAALVFLNRECFAGLPARRLLPGLTVASATN
ncbi:MAG: hypothetical protein U0031_17620 [Thermomicrobiales bacterium]